MFNLFGRLDARIDRVVDVVEDLMAENKKLKEKVVIHKKCQICGEMGHAVDMVRMDKGDWSALAGIPWHQIAAYGPWDGIEHKVEYAFFHPSCLKKAGYRKVEDNVAGWVKKK